MKIMEAQAVFPGKSSGTVAYIWVGTSCQSPEEEARWQSTDVQSISEQFYKLKTTLLTFSFLYPSLRYEAEQMAWAFTTF